jgi:hypothetical protein
MVLENHGGHDASVGAILQMELPKIHHYPELTLLDDRTNYLEYPYALEVELTRLHRYLR